MSLALRVTDDNLIWTDSPEEMPWLETDDIPADRITDLETQNNQLSIWLIKEDKEQLSRCLSAFAANRRRLSKLDYVIFDVNLLKNLDLDYIESKSTLKDKEINLLHRDIVNLSAKKLFSLAQLIMPNCNLGRTIKRDVAFLIANSINNGWILKDSIDPDLLSEIEKITSRTTQ